jgi:propionyl-CoA carboxylase alpha chain
MFYDPMIAKLCSWGPTRDAAVDGQAQALEDFHIEGLGHNLPFLSAVMDQPRFRRGRLSTAYIAEEFPDGFQGLEADAFQRDAITAAAAAMHRTLAARSLRTSGGGAAAPRDEWVILLGSERRPVRLSGAEGAFSVELISEGRTLRLDRLDWRPGRPQFRAALDGRPFSVSVKPTADGYVIRHRAAQVRTRVLTPLSSELASRLPERAPPDTSRQVVSPMPGLVISIEVAPGQEVRSGETLAVIEAMKMQNILRAERDGVVKTVGPKAGDSVAADEVLIEFA